MNSEEEGNKEENLEKGPEKVVEKEEEREEKNKIGSKIRRVNPWFISSIILIILLIGVLITPKTPTGMVTEPTTLTAEEVADKAIDYLNENLVQAGTTATLVSVKERSGVYEITTKYQGREIKVYATKDGKLLLTGEFDMTKKLEKPEQTTFDAPDREKPNVKFFVMSFCPFGNQAEEGLEPVFRLLGDRVEWEPHYVIYSNYATGYPDYCLDKDNKYCSMHGIQELHQDIRELCVWKYYNASTFWDFVMKINEECNSRNVDECWESIANETGIDIDKIKECQESEAVTLLQNELDLNEEYGVRGSPTVFINDEQYSGGRSPEAYKQAICSGFITQPDECNQTLSAGSSSAAGQC